MKIKTISSIRDGPLGLKMVFLCEQKEWWALNPIQPSARSNSSRHSLNHVHARLGPVLCCGVLGILTGRSLTPEWDSVWSFWVWSVVLQPPRSQGKCLQWEKSSSQDFSPKHRKKEQVSSTFWPQRGCSWQVSISWGLKILIQGDSRFRIFM